MDHSVVLRYIGISTASLSFVGSSIISSILVRSRDGLSVPYRRIIFGLSISDIIQSLGFIFGPFLVPESLSYVDIWTQKGKALSTFKSESLCCVCRMLNSTAFIYFFSHMLQSHPSGLLEMFKPAKPLESPYKWAEVVLCSTLFFCASIICVKLNTT